MATPNDRAHPFVAEFPASHRPTGGFLRLSAILAPLGPIPVGKSTWWAGVKSGRYPAPVKLGPRITVWRVADIQALIEGMPAGAGPAKNSSP